MVDEVGPGLFRVELPLPGNPLRSVNSYVVRGDDGNLIVDTGMNREECAAALRSGLEELGIALDRTDILITHMHADHSGLVNEFLSPGRTAYVGRMDAEMMRTGPSWEAGMAAAALHGFPVESLRRAIESHPARRYGGYGRVDYQVLPDGALISAGAYTFRCVETPGHTPGHICLYEPEKGILLSGDHVLGDITPNISRWSEEGDPLGDFLASLERIYELDVTLVLPGHRRVFRDCRGRIEELKRHHRVRAEEVLSILDGAVLSAYEVAARMTWDLTYDSFEQFPVAQQWFAGGEALAHLQYLEARGLVHRESKEGLIVYRR